MYHYDKLQILYPYFMDTPKIRYASRNDNIRHHKTCPQCGNTLVNLYRYGSEWLCNHCIQERQKEKPAG